MIGTDDFVVAQHAAPLQRKLHVQEKLFDDDAQKLFLPDPDFVRSRLV